MEGFLSTLPPYVHSYLERHPPTDVFHCLRELICFAVLYSNDRERIMTKTKQLLDKGADKIDDETKLLAARVYSSKPTGPSGRTSPSSIATVESFGTTELGTPRISATLPLTVPEWLDHSQAAEMPPPSSSAATAETTETNSSVPAPQAPKQRQALEVGRSIIAPSSPEPPASPRTNAKVDPPKADPPKQRRETITSWVPWDEQQQPESEKRTNRLSNSQNEAIPDLRSYLNPRASTPSPRPVSRVSSQKRTATPKTVAQRNITAVEMDARRMSAPICNSPTTVRASKTPMARAASVRETSPSPAPPMVRSSSTRSTSSYRPGQTATVRARLEHAKAQQLKKEEEKQKEARLSSVSMRIKQQAKPSMDWAAIKQQRRQTMPAAPSASAPRD